ncbi:MAG: AbrB/MazE/SpoVT family DNA-binding domain-containing protein [Patescibacteria group bacterium]
MRTNVIRIGNSKGVRIPKALLLESGLGSEVELTAKRGEIKIVPTSTKKSRIRLNDEYLMSIPVLRKDWDRPEEDKAWASLQ